MKIITTHIAPDYDGFASMMLAKKLYPDFEPIIPSGVNANLKKLMSLYKGIFPVHTKKILKNQIVEKLILVDTSKLSRIPEIANLIDNNTEIIIYDHHPPTSEDLIVKEFHYRQRGAASTILSEEIFRKNISLNPEEASLALLGIYADTGSFIFPSTTPDDMLTASYLLRQGGNLKFVKEYLQSNISDQYKDLYYEMMQHNEITDFFGYRIIFVKRKLVNYVKGLSTALQHISDIEGADAIFGLFSIEKVNRTYIIGQTSIDFLHMNKLMAKFGGGGHYAVGAATLNSLEDLDYLKNEILDFLDLSAHDMLKVDNVMRRSVVMLYEHNTCSEAERLMISNKIHGAPVINKEGDIIGMIELSSVKKAIGNGLKHAPVKAFMQKKIVYIQPNTSIDFAKKLIVEKGVSRLPVISEGNIVGIISRSDILRYLFGDKKDKDKKDMERLNEAS